MKKRAISCWQVSVVAGASRMSGHGRGVSASTRRACEQARAFTRTVSEIQTSINRVLQVVSVMLLPIVVLTFYSQNRIAGGHGETGARPSCSRSPR